MGFLEKGMLEPCRVNQAAYGAYTVIDAGENGHAALFPLIATVIDLIYSIAGIVRVPDVCEEIIQFRYDTRDVAV